MKTTSFKPHLVQAVHAWLSENDSKVYIHCAVDCPGFSMVPLPNNKFFDNLKITDDKGQERTMRAITLSLSPEAIGNFTINGECIYFSCRMEGRITAVTVPHEAVFSMTCPDSNLRQDLPTDLSFLLDPRVENTGNHGAPESEQKPITAPRPRPPYLTRVK